MKKSIDILRPVPEIYGYYGKIKKVHTTLDDKICEATALGVSYGEYRALLTNSKLLRKKIKQIGLPANTDKIEKLRSVLLQEWIRKREEQNGK